MLLLFVSVALSVPVVDVKPISDMVVAHVCFNAASELKDVGYQQVRWADRLQYLKRKHAFSKEQRESIKEKVFHSYYLNSYTLENIKIINERCKKIKIN